MIKAIILAAGKGERLGKITRLTPKPMLKVKGEIILEHNIKWLRSFGIKNIYINLHYLPKAIMNYLKYGEYLGVNINYSFEPKILGTAGAVRKIAKNWKTPFLVIYGDNFYPFNYNLNDFIVFSSKRDAMISIGLYRKKKEISKSGVVLLSRGNKIIDFKEKPLLSSGGLASNKDILINTGIYLLRSECINYIPRGYSDFGKDIFPVLVKMGIPIYGYVFKKSLVPIDTIELYKKVAI